jgi:hypothetical protein
MRPRPLLGLVVLALALAVTGCAAPTDQQSGRNVSVSLSNQAPVSYEATVFLVTNPIDGVDATYQNGSTRQFDVATVDALPPGALSDATNVSIRGPEVQRHQFDLPPRSGVGATYQHVSPNASVIHTTAASGGSLEGWGVSSCSPSSDLELTIEIAPDRNKSVSTRCFGD